MKVAFISYLYPPRSALGGAKIAYKLSKAIEAEGVEVVRITQNNIDSVHFLHFAWKARSIARDCDIAHGSTLGDIFIEDTPCVTSLHHPERYNKGSLLRRIISKYAEKRCFKKARGVTTLSRRVKDELAEMYGEEEKIDVVHPGVDRVKNPEEGDVNTILCTAGTGERKGIEYLIEAVSIVNKTNPSIKLRIFGVREEHREEIKKTVDKFGVQKNVVALGAIFDEKLDREYRNAGIVAVPSLYEGFGLPIIEGMAYRKPVITTPVGITQEIVQDKKNAILVEMKSPQSIANAINSLISNENLRGKIAGKGYETSKDFTWEKSAKKTIEVYNKALELS
ncbi:MAG: glycosyltransferase family 4 protein [Candidatus Altiarchaeota archaeon]